MLQTSFLHQPLETEWPKCHYTEVAVHLLTKWVHVCVFYACFYHVSTPYSLKLTERENNIDIQFSISKWDVTYTLVTINIYMVCENMLISLDNVLSLMLMKH